MKNKLNFLIILIITIIVLYFSLKDDFNTIINSLLAINLYWVLVGCGLVVGYWFFRSLVMYLFIREFKDSYSFKEAFELTLATQFFHAITPFAAGGQPYEIYQLKRQDIKMSSVTNIVIQNFITYQIALILLGLIAVISNYFFHIFKEVGFLKELVLLGFFINLMVIVVLFLISYGEKFNKIVVKWVIILLSKLRLVKNRNKTINAWKDYINDFHGGANLLFEKKSLFLKTVVINFIGLIALYLVPLVVFYSLGNYHSLDGVNAIITSSYVMLIGSFVPIPGASGGLEYGFTQFYGNFIGGPTLVAAMLVWRLLTYYLGMIVGALVFNMKGDR